MGLLSAESGLRWFAIQTKPNQEAAVSQRLSSLGFEVMLPLLRVWRRVGTRYQWVLEPVFPGYLFCRFDLALSGKAVRYAPGVKDFLKLGDYVPEVSSEVIQSLRGRCPDGVAEVRPGAGEPRKVSGPYFSADFEKIFGKETEATERQAILLGILGRQGRP